MRLRTILITLALVPLHTIAHHGPPDSAMLYERSQILEFEGEITDLEERFTVTGNGQRLEYTMTATDPETFTQPVTLERFWRWTPEIEYEPFDCADWGE